MVSIGADACVGLPLPLPSPLIFGVWAVGPMTAMLLFALRGRRFVLFLSRTAPCSATVVAVRSSADWLGLGAGGGFLSRRWKRFMMVRMRVTAVLRAEIGMVPFWMAAFSGSPK